MANEPDRDELNREDPEPGEDVRGLEDEGEEGDLEDEADSDESTA